MKARLVFASACLAACAFSLAGCTSQVATDLDAPLKAIGATDVVVETNVQSALQAAQTELQTTGSLSGFTAGGGGGVALTSGPSPSDGQLSYAVTGGGEGVVLVGWNKADEHCIGAVWFHSEASTPVLGQSAPGQYDFVAPAASDSECDAASFANTAAAPAGWPESPASSWKLP